MARPLRIEYEGAWYHAMNRGGSRRTVFNDVREHQAFLKVLGEAHETYGLEVHAFCLMPNHYHLLARTPRGNLGRAMRHVDGVYTQWVNRATDADGALFRGRYRAKLVDADQYLVAVARYIHLNPVRAKLVATPGAFRWSSHRYYTGHGSKPSWLFTSVVLGQFDSQTSPDEAFHEFVVRDDDKDAQASFAQLMGSPVIGDSDFAASLERRYAEHKEIPQSKRPKQIIDIAEIVDVVATAFGVSASDVRNRSYGSHARMAAIWLSRSPGGHSNRAVAEAFGLAHYSAVSAARRRLSQALEGNRNVAGRFHAARRAVLLRMSIVKT